MSTTVSGSIVNLAGMAQASGLTLRFILANYGNNIPRVAASGAIFPNSDGVYYFDITPNASGNVPNGTTIFSNTDSSGTGNGDIEAGGVSNATYYMMQVINNGVHSAAVPVLAKSGVTLNINSVTPITSVPPVTTTPTDQVYARLDGGNQPFTGTTLQIPSGGVYKLGTDVGLSRFGAAVALFGNGTAGNQAGAWIADLGWRVAASANSGWSLYYDYPKLQTGSTGVLGWTNGTPTAASDTGLSRTAAATIAIGNGTQGDFSGTLKCAALNTGTTIPSPVINGTPSGTGIPTISTASGSDTTNYTITAGAPTFADVDGTNLAITKTVPTGWKAIVIFTGAAQNGTTTNPGYISIADGTTNLTVSEYTSGTQNPFTVMAVLVGDGASHTFKARGSTTGSSLTILNGNQLNTVHVIPQLIVILTPSN